MDQFAAMRLCESGGNERIFRSGAAVADGMQ